LVNITFSLPEETVKKLREVAKRVGGARRGAISELVDVAIKEHLEEVESRIKQEEFRATRGNEVVARAGSLRELAATLERRKVDPREVLIVSSSPLEPSVRTGLRRQFD
jgi:metal-responsive CopG/Arc/MetJ family transcriptional regulator